MSANGEAPFFNAPELPQRDGTLAGPIGETFADPVAGLVTAGAEPRAAVANGSEPPAIPVAGPVPHDPEVVRRMVEGALSEQDGQGAPQTPEAIPPAGTLGTLAENGKPPLGVLPRQRTWPTRPPQLLRPIRPAQKLAEAVELPAEEEPEVPPPTRRRRLPALTMPTISKPSSNTTGVLLAVALLIVFGIVAIEMVSSLVSSVTGLFK